VTLTPAQSSTWERKIVNPTRQWHIITGCGT
jgi:hypothetical protein